MQFIVVLLYTLWLFIRRIRKRKKGDGILVEMIMSAILLFEVALVYIFWSDQQVNIVVKAIAYLAIILFTILLLIFQIKEQRKGGSWYKVFFVSILLLLESLAFYDLFS